MHMRVDPRTVNGVLTIDVHVTPPPGRPMTYVASTRTVLSIDSGDGRCEIVDADINLYINLT